MEKKGQVRNDGRTLWFFVNLIFGLYFVNIGLKFIPLSLPESLNNWIMIIGGVLVIISGLMSLTRNRMYPGGYYRR